MWPRSLRRFGGVLIGIVVGSGVASLLVAWPNEGFYIRTPTPSIRPGKENIGLVQETGIVSLMSLLGRYVQRSPIVSAISSYLVLRLMTAFISKNN